MLLSKFSHASRHAKELREVIESRSTRFCRYLSFIRDALDRVRSLILLMVLASLGS
jgi:hypothetical protein